MEVQGWRVSSALDLLLGSQALQKSLKVCESEKKKKKQMASEGVYFWM